MATNLSAGSIAFTGYNGSGNDNLSFVVLTDIASGTVINFTDNTWNGTSFVNSESIFTWTATDNVAAGTVIDLDNLKNGNASASASIGTLNFTDSSNLGLSNDNETVYAYTESAGSPKFLAAISNVGFTGNNGDKYGTLTGTGLTEGVNAIAFSGGVDTVGYSGSLSGMGSFADYLSAINNSANWAAVAAGAFPTTPFTVAPPAAAQTVSFTGTTSITVNEGDAGAQTVTFTVQRTGGTAGDFHFTVKVVGSSGLVNGDDFGGTMPGLIEGVILDGQTTATFTLTYTGDTRYEAKDGITVQLIAASNDEAPASVATGSKGLGRLTLTNDDPVPTKIAAGDIVEGSVSLTGDQTFVIEKGGLMIGSTGTVPITWAGTNSHVTIDNSGTIQAGAGGSAISLSSSATGTMEIDNHLDGQILGLLNLNSRPGATVTINNDGLINGGIGFANKIGGGGGTINNSATGIVTADTADGTAIGNGGNVEINNWGKIVVPADTAALSGGDAIDFKETQNNSVHNYNGGLIEGSHHAITGSLGVTVINDAGGTIIGRNGSAVNIDNSEDPANTVYVTNRGAMEGRSAGYADSDGDAIDNDGLLRLDNYGTIKGLGANGTHDGGANVSEGVAIGGGVINNYAGATIYGYGRAIQADDSANGGALAATTITNEGTIQGDGNGPQNFDPGSDAGIVIANREAIDILGTFADTITNRGTIIGGVFTDGGDDTLTNSGTMTALKTVAIDMGDGNDKVVLQAGSNITGSILLGAGDDSFTAIGVTKQANVDGGDGNDTIVGTDAGDIIAGGAGNDTITGGKGADQLSGGDGDDTFKLGLDMLGSGTRTIVLGDGTTATVSIDGLAGTQDVISGGAGYDKIVLDKAGTSGYVFDTTPAAGSYTGIEEIDGTSGNDVIMVTATYQSDAVGGGIKLDGGAGNDTLGGGAGNDTLLGGDGNDLISGLGGNDTLQGAAGNDTIYGGDGDDYINGGSGADVLYGDAGVDTIYGSDGNDEIHGGDGNDQLQGEGGDDTIYGDAGSDFVVGGDGNDTIHGGDGNDQLFGQNGNDTIEGGAGADKLSGDGGNDTLIAGAGDTVLGGTGDDAIYVSIQDGNPASIDGGDGSDTVHLGGVGVGAFGKTANVETLDVDAGIWTADGTANYDAITIAAGAALMNTISVEHSMTITVGGTLNSGDDRAITADDGLDDGSTLIVNVLEGGVITSGDDAIRIKDNFKNGTVTIDNAGTITATGGQAIDLTDVTAKSTAITITNEASGIITAIDADAIRGGGNTTIDNFGSITSIATGDDVNDAIDFQDDGGGTVHNHAGGSIIGAHHGITGSKAVTVINDLGGTIIGQSGSAVNIDNDVTSIVTVTNYGTMLGMANPEQADSDGDAVDVDGLLNLDNYGQIRGMGANGYHDGTKATDANISEGIAAGGGTINNYAGATIYGYGRAIQIDDSANGGALASTTIYNEGTIQGDGHGPSGVSPEDAATMQASITGREAIDILGTFADTITNKGQIIGGVFTDGGGDTFNAYVGSTVTGKIDLGDGNDTVNLLATDGNTATGILGSVTNAENLIVEGGSWAVTDASSFSNIDVKGGAKIRNVQGVADSLALTGGQHLTVEQGGSVESYSIGFDNDGNPEEVLGTSLLLKGDLNAIIDNSGTIKGIAEVGTMDGVIFVPPTGHVTINNHETGVISGGMVLLGAANTVDNFGQIIGADDNNTIAINATIGETVTTIVNHTGGLITTRADQNVIQAGDGTTIDNAGTIRSMDDYTDSEGNLIAGKDAIAFKSSDAGGSVHNEDGGLIEGSHHAVSGKGSLTVVNDEGGTMIGRNGSAVNVDNKSGVANTVFVTNHGTMLGQSMGYDDSDGDAVDVDALIKLDNYGTIRGEGANGTHDGGANVSEGVAIGGGVINNYAGATIYGYGRAIQVDDSANGAAKAATTITNEGTIQGDGHGPQNFEPGSDAGIVIAGREAIDILGTFADTITNKGTGKIIGGIFTDGGDDIFNAYVGSSVTGKIDLGDGNDTVNLFATVGSSATGNLGTVVNAENLNVKSGSWTIANSQNYKTIDVATDATVAAALILGAGETLTIEQGGTVQGPTSAVVVNGGTSDTLVINDGNIKVLAAAGQKDDAITVNSGTVTVHNTGHGVIEGARHAITGPGAITVINDAGGLIVGHNGSAVNMDNGSSEAEAAHVTNYGTMLGDSAEIADSDGDAVDVDGIVYLDNYGMIRGEGANGTHKGEANVSEGVAAGGGTIHNYAGATIYGYGRAIQIDNSSNAAAFTSTTIINDGTIQGDGHGPKNYETGSANNINVDNREAIDILGSFADTITNTATGKILGGVFTDGGADTLTNSGTMTALKDMAIDMGAGDDTVTNNATGTITGSVALGDGDDHLSNDGTITVTSGNAVSMGAGDDYMGLSGTITGNVDGGAGNDEVNIQSTAHINGTVSLGDGNDHFQSLGEIKAADASAVAIDMGAGDDTVNLYTGTTVQGTIELGTGNDILNSTANGSYVVDGGDGNDSIAMSSSPGGGDDVLNGGAGNDSLDGGIGNDTLSGGEGDDTLLGSAGNDTLIGGNGSDLYYYWSGGGDDTIIEGAGNAGDFDTLSLRDFNINDVTLARSGDDLVVTMQDGSKVVVSDQFAGGGVENIVFKDGAIDRNGVIDATNHAPTVDATVVTVDEDHSIAGQISATDPDGDKLTYSTANDHGQHHGSLFLGSNGKWTYTPDHDFNGHDTFTITVNDGHTSVDTTIDVTVNPVNDAPVAVDDTGRVGEHDTATFDLTANDTDVDAGDGHPNLVHFEVDGVDGINVSKEAAAGAFQIVDGKLVFHGGDIFGALNDGEHATVTISYTAEDSSGAPTTGEFVLTIDGVTDMHQVNGTDGSDVLFDTAADDHIIGGNGADVIFTASGSDIVDAGAGNDTVMALTGNATVNGGDGNDTIVGGTGNTVLNGDGGNDTITGGSGNETLNGGAGNDTLIANSGNDRLIGGQGNDLLIGGTGSDTFVFKPGDGQDSVANFKAGNGSVHDVIEVDSHTFANFDAVMAAIHDTASGAQIQYGDGSTLTLSGITKDHLVVDDFHFA
ncbi:Ig-like domain-containing protein [Bradyrhizobium sp. SYSU BS000235]|uniref:Ig-like domain-containing protein n=1 Tax=Bradyrhizobium sp. SYSU BS000235 TaxID=3411332 RepID=UPI003C756B6C